MNADPVLTPNLNRLAAEGIVFTHAVSNYPVCSPYRAMLFSGKYPHANHVISNCNSQTRPHGVYLREDERCLTDVLHDAGYSQGYIGKLHLDAPLDENAPYTEGRRGDGRIWDAYTPPGPRRHGIDFWHSYGCCDLHLTPHYWVGDAAVDQRLDVTEWSVKHEADVAVDYIRNPDGAHRNPARPFALFLAHNPPHTPFQQVPETYVSRYGDATAETLLNRPNVRFEGNAAQAEQHVKNYFAAVTGIDDNLGRILEALDEKGLTDNTIVIFTADHGEMMGSHGRMHKDVWYDESLFVPFIMRWPARLAPRRDDLLLSVPDIMPTLLSMMELGEHVPADVQGRDWSNAILNGTGERPASALYITIPYDRPTGGRRGVRTHRYTYVVDRQSSEEEAILLHDSETDPYQMRNVVAEQPAVAAELRDELRSWLHRTGDPFRL
jgi:arylsulfatase A-like enzyme